VHSQSAHHIMHMHENSGRNSQKVYGIKTEAWLAVHTWKLSSVVGILHSTCTQQTCFRYSTSVPSTIQGTPYMHVYHVLNPTTVSVHAKSHCLLYLHLFSFHFKTNLAILWIQQIFLSHIGWTWKTYGAKLGPRL